MNMKIKKAFAFFTFYFFVFFSFSQNWQQLPGFPAAGRDDGSTFIIGNNVYCGLGNAFGIGPSTDFYKFNPLTDTWPVSSVASLPAIGRQYCSSFSYLSYGYVIGGVDANWFATNEVWRYDTVTNNWMQKTQVPDSVFGAVCFFINNKAYVCGGRDQNNQCTKKVWEYDIINNTWAQKNNMPGGGRWRASGAVINNKGYLVFGADSLGKFSNKLFEFDAGIDSWNLIDSFPGMGRTYASAGAVNNFLVIALGIDSNNAVYNDCHLYDINSHQWINQNSLPSFGRKGCMAFTFNNNFYLAAGIDVSNTRLIETWKASTINAIKESDNSDFVIYPNPANTIMNLEFGIKNGMQATKYMVRVTNIIGEEIKSLRLKIVPGKTEIDISNLDNGIYFLSAGSSKQKIIIQH